jgi:ureidoglycolate lyase
MREIRLQATALSAVAFAEFGDVIETEGRESRWINEGTCRRFDGVAHVDVLEAGGLPLVSVFEAQARELPLRIRTLERHPLSSQAFMPLQTDPFLIVVAQDGTVPIGERIRAFVSSGRQGVNFRRNTWHHALIALGQPSRFLVVDRGGPEQNCEEVAVDTDVVVVVDVGGADTAVVDAAVAG